MLSRVSTTPFSEKTEEIRLQIVGIMLIQVQMLSEESVSMLGDIMLASSKLLGDSFPDVKKQTASLIFTISSNDILKKYAGNPSPSVLRSLILNLGHQHSKVRSITMQAIFSLLALEHAGERLVDCTKELKKVILNDKSTDVRKKGYYGCHLLLTSFGQSLLDKHEAFLTAILLNGLAESFHQEILDMLEDAGTKRRELAI